MVTMGLITMAIIVLLGVVQILFSTYSIASDPQLTVLEAGFENLKPSLVFSSSFFSLVALFVLFDMELILFFPGMLYLVNLNYLKVKCWILLLMVVLMTLLLEWMWYGLKWQM